MHVHKSGPGRYSVWMADLYIVFRTERDAQRFVNASHYAFKRSWVADEVRRA